MMELDELNKKGVKISLEGREVDPMRIVDEFLLNEESSYMRDYILDENGNLIELGFNIVKSQTIRCRFKIGYVSMGDKRRGSAYYTLLSGWWEKLMEYKRII